MIIPWPKGFGPYIVMDIGCLECHHSTEYLGHFPSVEAAKARFSRALTHEEQTANGWRGEGITIIYDLRREQINDPNAC